MIGCPETSVTTHSVLHTVPEKQKSQERIFLCVGNCSTEAESAQPV